MQKFYLEIEWEPDRETAEAILEYLYEFEEDTAGLIDAIREELRKEDD